MEPKEVSDASHMQTHALHQHYYSILPVHKLDIYQRGLFIHKVVYRNNDLPGSFQSFFTFCSDVTLTGTLTVLVDTVVLIIYIYLYYTSSI